MSAKPLHFELPPEERPSPVPWLIVLACAAILLIQLSQLATRIPAELEQQAQEVLRSADSNDLLVTANGRDLEVSGTLNIDKPIGPLIDELYRIEGVRQISDDVVIVDPAVQQQRMAQEFADALAGIDTTGVGFRPGSVTFTPDSDAALTRLLALLQRYPQGRIRIEGHTDDTGPDTVNLRVSRERAQAVANFLMARGIASDQLVVIGYGSTQPIADNTTEAGRARNRRIEINAVGQP